MTPVQWWCSGVVLRNVFHQRTHDPLVVDYAAQDLQAVDYATTDLQAVDYAAEDLQAVDYAAQDHLAAGNPQVGSTFDCLA